LTKKRDSSQAQRITGDRGWSAFEWKQDWTCRSSAKQKRPKNCSAQDGSSPTAEAELKWISFGNSGLNLRAAWRAERLSHRNRHGKAGSVTRNELADKRQVLERRREHDITLELLESYTRRCPGRQRAGSRVGEVHFHHNDGDTPGSRSMTGPFLSRPLKAREVRRADSTGTQDSSTSQPGRAVRWDAKKKPPRLAEPSSTTTKR